MINLFGSRAQADPAAVSRIKQWVAAAYALADDVTLMVTELRCTEPGCPPLETVIAVLRPGQPPFQHKLHKAVIDVIESDIAGLAQSAPLPQDAQ
jgi:hypothetical protein